MNSANLPKGFENKEISEAQFKGMKDKAIPNGPGMRRGPGGPPGGPGAMGRMVEKPKDLKKTISRLLTYFKKSSKLVFLLIAVVVSVTLTSLITPAIQGSSIDAIKNAQWHLLLSLLIWLLISYGVHTLFSLFQSILSARLSQSIVRSLRFDLFKKIDNLPISYLDTHSNGDVMSRLTNDVDNISNTVFQSLGSLISGILTIVGTVAIMLWYCLH